MSSVAKQLFLGSANVGVEFDEVRECNHLHLL
jgi:hypothetical protein